MTRRFVDLSLFYHFVPSTTCVLSALAFHWNFCPRDAAVKWAPTTRTWFDSSRRFSLFLCLALSFVDNSQRPVWMEMIEPNFQDSFVFFLFFLLAGRRRWSGGKSDTWSSTSARAFRWICWLELLRQKIWRRKSRNGRVQDRPIAGRARLRADRIE